MRWVAITLLMLVFVGVIGALLLLWPPVQTKVVHLVGHWASEQLGTEVRVGSVMISPRGEMVLGDVFIADLEGDTLIAASELRFKALRIHPRAQVIQVGGVHLHNARFAMTTPLGSTKSNLTLLMDKFSSEDTTSSDAAWQIKVKRFDIHEFHYSFYDRNSEPIPFGVDFKHINITHATVAGTGFAFAGDSLQAQLKELQLTERSGLVINELSGLTHVSPRGIIISDMELRTGRSNAKGQFAMITNSWADYNEFNQKVNMKLQLDTANVDFRDISMFAPELEGIHYPIGISGRMRGTVAELKGFGLYVTFGSHSWFTGNAEFSGLPDIANTFMVLNIDELSTDHQDLSHIPLPPFTSGATLVLPTEIAQLGTINFAGNFTGFTRAFTAYGRTRTKLGSVKTDISYNRDTLKNIFTLSGRVLTEGFDLGPIAGTNILGPLACNVRLSATGKTFSGLKADLEGEFPMVTVNGTKITNIMANGRLERNLFNGELDTDDENIRMHFVGLADLRKRWPVVDFKAKVEHLDLRALGFVKTPGYNSLKMSVQASGRLSPDSLLGSLAMQDISYCVGPNDHELGDLLLRSGRANGKNTLEMEATFATARVEGTFLPTRLLDLATNTVYSVFPALRKNVNYDQTEQWFTFEVETGDSRAILDLIAPGTEIAPGSMVSGSLDSRSFDIDLTANIPQVRYGTTVMDSVEVIMDKTLDVLAFAVRSTKQTIGDSTWFSGTSATGVAYQDELELALGWKNSNAGTNGHLDIQGEVRGLQNFDLDLLPSQLYFGRGNWNSTRTAHFTIDSTTVAVDSLVLWNEDQRISLHGVLSKDPLQAMDFEMDRVRLENLAPLVRGPLVAGSVHGDGRVFDVYGTPFLTSYLCVDSVKVADKLIGDIKFSAGWSESRGVVELNGTVERGPIKALDFNGRLEPKRDNLLAIDIVFDQFDLTFIEPYLPSAISEIQGLVTGTATITGTAGHPLVNGTLDMVDAGLRINYLNTLYRFTHKVKVAPDMFALDLVTIRDEEGHTARIGGTILHNGLKDWNFNVWGTMDRLMVLNTTVADNDSYYGKAYATGDVEVSGSIDQLDIVVDASTAMGTDIHFPVGGSTEVSDIGFVRFVTSDSTGSEGQLVDLSGITLDMNVEVTPDARFEIIFDPTVGDIMRGRGQGDMEMSVSQTGDFRMLGQVEVSEGDYLFTLRNVVNKRFEVIPGGTIAWFGDPFDAQLDLRALYKVRASLYDIMFEKNEAYKKRVPVDVVMRLRDKLMNPEIGFEVRLPTVDESIRTQVNSVLSTEQELNRQVFALIVLNRFVSPPTYTGTGSPSAGGNFAGTTTSELLSNQVSNWLSKLSNDFDLGVNYRPGDNITQDELEVAMSTQLFNERLLLSTNLGVSYGAQTASNTNNTLIGDFQLEYLLTPEGRLRVKAFSMSNDRNLTRTDQIPTTQGAGVVYREEFRTLGELWQKLRNNFRPDSRDRHFD